MTREYFRMLMRDRGLNDRAINALLNLCRLHGQNSFLTEGWYLNDTFHMVCELGYDHAFKMLQIGERS